MAFTLPFSFALFLCNLSSKVYPGCVVVVVYRIALGEACCAMQFFGCMWSTHFLGPKGNEQAKQEKRALANQMKGFLNHVL